MYTNERRVLLIGGNSGAGKTHLAKALVRHLGIPFIMADDVRIALQQVTNPAQQLNLHIFLDYQPEQWKQPHSIVQDWLRVGNAMINPLKQIMAHHIAVEGSGQIIIEGDSVLPSLAAQNTFDDIPGFESLDIAQKVRSVFLIEHNEAHFLSNLCHRNRGISAINEEEQMAFVRASWLFGQWLEQDAQARQIPVLSAHPRENVMERLLEVTK